MAKKPADIVPDARLWDAARKRYTPLQDADPRLGQFAIDGDEDHGPSADRPKQESTRPKPAPARTQRKSPPQAKPPAASKPPVNNLDRRVRQKLMRGQADIDARIDLHGETVASAYTKLLGFLSAAQNNQQRLVLVITGKGQSPYARHTLHGAKPIDTPERQGVLRRRVLDWLETGEFSAFVAGFQPAHPKHGGGGALYLRIRRRR